MDFWNEYEGKTIAESFPLEKLLYPEGRNGFFSTFNGTGTPAVIRLTESLNDQEEMFEQWKTVAGLNHPHLITIRKFGATTVDEVPLIYAVMEPSDAGLAEMLRERAMTPAETTEIATGVIPALQSLHAAGLVHGHIDPSSILAVGETVKLRSDCAYRIIDPDDLLKRQSRDVKDVAILLLQALTQQRRAAIEESTTVPSVAGPLGDVIRHGLSGSWGLDEMAAAIRPGAPLRSKPPVAPAAPSASATATPKEPARAPESAPPKKTAAPLASEEIQRAAFTGVNPLFAAGFLLFLSVMAVYFFHLFRIDRATALSQAAVTDASAPPAGSASGSSFATSVASPAPSSAPPATIPAESPRPAVSAAPQPEPPVVHSVSPAITPAASGDHGNWRVVVFTYNKESQAEQKAKAIDHKHHSLKAEVFSPSGRSPYLVVLGGGMTREEATVLKRKAHSEGLPRDTYIQNYEAR